MAEQMSFQDLMLTAAPAEPTLPYFLVSNAKNASQFVDKGRIDDACLFFGRLPSFGMISAALGGAGTSQPVVFVLDSDMGIHINELTVVCRDQAAASVCGTATIEKWNLAVPPIAESCNRFVTAAYDSTSRYVKAEPNLAFSAYIRSQRSAASETARASFADDTFQPELQVGVDSSVDLRKYLELFIVPSFFLQLNAIGQFIHETKCAFRTYPGWQSVVTGELEANLRLMSWCHLVHHHYIEAGRW